MVKKFKFGEPVETKSILEKINTQPESTLPFLSASFCESGTNLTYIMGDSDVVYGLGEANRGINKRGWRYESYCNDDAGHTENKRALYGAHNFVAVDGSEKFAFYLDYPGYVSFDIGSNDSEKIDVYLEDKSFYLYIITGESMLEIMHEFRVLIGQSYIPPYWALGYQQSRWGYRNADDVKEVASSFRKNSIPLDAIYLDIDYMESYKDFTVDDEKFPDFKGFVDELKADNIRLVPIIDAGVKIESDYDVFEEGVEKGYFCKRADGSNFVAGVWPGKTHFPDFCREDVRSWFGAKYKKLIDMGIEGFWNDMNEPAIFYSEEGLAEAFEQYQEITAKPLDVTGFFALLDNFNHLANNHKDYDRFFHELDGKIIPDRKLHNIYGFYMTMAAGQAFEQITDNRILLFSRASYIGMHRYGGIWTGDNQSWWSHILLGIKMMPALSMCGFLYTGTDIGGFGSDTTEDLVLRWLQFGIFTPLMRNHAAFNTAEQEPYRFKRMDAMRNVIELRYALIPHLYTELIASSLESKLLFKPIALEFPHDNRAKTVEDQLFLGDSVMIAPIYEQNARGRYVYLPEEMLLVVFKSFGERRYEVLKKGEHYIEAALEETPLFIRKNRFIPLVKPAESTAELRTDYIELLGFMPTAETASYTLYEDDGFSKDYENPSHYKQITVTKSGGNFTVQSDKKAEFNINIKA